MIEDEVKAKLTKDITNHIREIEELDVVITSVQKLRAHHTKCLHGCLDDVRSTLQQNMPSDDEIITPTAGGTNKR